MAGRILHQVEAGELQRDLSPQGQQDVAGVQLCRRRGLRPLRLEMGEISLVPVKLKPVMPHMRRQQEKFPAVDRMVLPVDAEGPRPADHQHQDPLGHHPVRVHVPIDFFPAARYDAVKTPKEDAK